MLDESIGFQGKESTDFQGARWKIGCYSLSRTRIPFIERRSWYRQVHSNCLDSLASELVEEQHHVVNRRPDRDDEQIFRNPQR